ncbi:MAG: MurR/RpiR family transcriptional regulator [Synergistaceae bacterium]|nr:MurR/RpiR family transcriptional regulator [Synergistaceae bacterium]
MGWRNIENNLSILPPAQRKIAEYMLENKLESIFLTALQIGKNAGSSEASAIRLASNLGFSSFPEFIKSLQEEAKNQLSTLGRLQMHKLKPQTGGMVARIINSDLEQAGLTLSTVNDESIKNLAAKICSSEAIFIIGLRSTRSLSVYMEYYLSWFFSNVFLPTTDTIGNNLVSAPKNSIVIGISFPRYTRQTVECIALAKKNKFLTAAITDSPFSPLAKAADMSIISPCAHIAHIDSLLIPMGLINTLLIQVAEQLGPKALKRLKELEKSWADRSIYC